MGGGFYDRSLAYLARRQSWRKPTLLGLAHECQKVERPYLALAIGVHAWLQNAKTVGLQLIPRPYALEYHLGAWPGAEYRQVSRLAPALSGAQVIGFLVSIPLSIARVSSKRWVR